MAKVISDEQGKLVDAVKNQLMEHFDTVRIMVTKHDGPSDETECYTVGGGNIYAQQGFAHDWLKEVEEAASRESEDDK